MKKNDSLFPKLILLSLILSAIVACFDKPTNGQNNQNGEATISITTGRVGALSKDVSIIDLNYLILKITSPGEDTILDTLPLSGNDANNFQTSYFNLTSQVTWTLNARTVDQNGMVIHSGQTSFVVPPNEVANVSLNLDSRYFMLNAHYFPIPDSVDRLTLESNGQILKDTIFPVQSLLGDTVSLSHDYMWVDTSHYVVMSAWGSMWGLYQTLYQGDTTISVLPGTDTTINLTLYWVGPGEAPNGTGEINVALGVIGTVDVYGEFDSSSSSSIMDSLSSSSEDSLSSPSSGLWWQPAPGTTFHWQLQDSVDLNRDVDMYDIDLFDTPFDDITYLKNRGVTVMCYFSAGSWENWRFDANDFPEIILGNDLDGWDGEKWLDIRDTANLWPLMQARLDLAVEKGCDGVEPDNVDGYTNNSGFSLTPSDQLIYNEWLANEAHARGLSIGLKNAVELIPDLVDNFDWALNEQCFQYEECGEYAAFTIAGKAVFGVEYELIASDFCDDANAAGYSWIQKPDYTLDGRVGTECWNWSPAP